jgi:hypothetical protein
VATPEDEIAVDERRLLARLGASAMLTVAVARLLSLGASKDEIEHVVSDTIAFVIETIDPLIHDW